MIQTAQPATHLALRIPTVSLRAPEASRDRMLFGGTTLLVAVIIAVVCTSAKAQEVHKGAPTPVDIVFGPPSLANAEVPVGEPTHRPRPLEPFEVDPISVQESVLPPLAESTPYVTSPAGVPDEARYCRPNTRGECCPVVGPMHHRWHHHTKPWLQATHWGYPEYFIERPFGSYAAHAARVQIANGLQDQQVLYHYDFLADRDAAQLSPRGRYELQKIVRRMQMVAVPIVVQQSEYPELDDARRRNVLDALAEMQIPAGPEMVVVDRAPVPGLQGIEGERINENLLQQTLQRGGGFQIDPGGFVP